MQAIRLPSNKERAERYQKHAAHFRQMAEAEPIKEIRQQLLDLAEQYQQLADNLRLDARRG